ncbi:transglycosylase domain-containing protein [Alkalicoccobacillus plakortidis]|uniref:Transglycosylase domain-containing protein n=1 Tax=Alkalicoccobacillus plakortidis TaxID=444060 RepID=A0ABT0XLE2_9BACI|nr:transglycosylase domain-containing protein [Alkalicoccobacillus plakortidis]MCM2676729.1 transglycosylase domain-containing protein [Alkalicoccobacillus plakortidis]
MRQSTGWLIIVMLCASFVLLLTRVGAEVNDVETLSEAFDANIELGELFLSSNSYILDSEGRLVSEIYKDSNRIYKSYDQIPKLFIDSFVSTEDRRFYEHEGYDTAGIARAFVANSSSSETEQGGSTITQQLVRNIYLSHEQTYQRKLSEILYSRELEKRYTKDDILELYLNSIFFGHQAYGIESASQYYFSKSSNDLSIAQVAFLTAIPNNPSFFDPINHQERTEDRKGWVLKKMLDEEKITEEEYVEATEETIELAVQKRTDMFPDYVTYIRDEFRDLVAEEDGFNSLLDKATTPEQTDEINKELDERIQRLYDEGIAINTALKPLMQKQAVQSVINHIPNESIQGSLAVIDNESNNLVAITGGKGYEKFNFNRGYQDFRQPGSAIKPLLAYAPYIDVTGVGPSARIDSKNKCYPNGPEDYCPKNYDGKEIGSVTLSQGLASSYNTTAVALLDKTGLETSYSYLDKFHFEKVEDSDRNYLPTALGGFRKGVSPLEMTRAYTTFAHDGAYTPAHGITEVKDGAWNVLYSWDEPETQVWSKATNDKMRQMLAGVVKNGTGRSINVSAPYVGGKTGTSNNYQEIWFVGLTDQYTTGILIGRDQDLEGPKSIESFAKSNPHQKIFNDIMK